MYHRIACFRSKNNYLLSSTIVYENYYDVIKSIAKLGNSIQTN